MKNIICLFVFLFSSVVLAGPVPAEMIVSLKCPPGFSLKESGMYKWYCMSAPEENERKITDKDCQRSNGTASKLHIDFKDNKDVCIGNGKSPIPVNCLKDEKYVFVPKNDICKKTNPTPLKYKKPIFN